MIMPNVCPRNLARPTLAQVVELEPQVCKTVGDRGKPPAP